MTIETNEVLLNAINNLFEHPDAIKLLLENATLNAAISNYVNAVAEKLKPDSGWKEVWGQVSEARIFTFHEYQGNGKLYPMPVVGQLTVRFSEREDVARLYARIIPTERYLGDRIYAVTKEDVQSAQLLNLSQIVESYGEAITWGQSHWPEALRLFEERTTSITETDGAS